MDAPTDDYDTLYPEGSAIAKMLEKISIEEAVAGIVPKGEAVEAVVPGDDTAEEIIPGDDTAEEIIPGDDTAEEIVPGGEKAVHTMIWLGVLIGAVVVVSAVLLKKPKRK